MSASPASDQARVLEPKALNVLQQESDRLLSKYEEVCPEAHRMGFTGPRVAAALLGLVVTVACGFMILASSKGAGSGLALVGIAPMRQSGVCVDLYGVRYVGSNWPLSAVWLGESKDSFLQCSEMCRGRADCRLAVFSATDLYCHLYTNVVVEGASLEMFNASICGDADEEGQLEDGLKKTTPADRFLQITRSSCTAMDLLTISNQTMCDRAASQLGLGDNGFRPLHTIWTRPEGCYVHTDYADDTRTIFFNTNPRSAGRGAEPWNNRTQICREKPALETCSPTGENCMFSQCCKEEGHQCYMQGAHWSTCLRRCPEDWNCTRLGDRTPKKHPICRKGGPDCTEDQCCVTPGLQCYERNAGYASCGLKCPGGDWTCKPLGPRTPMKNNCTWPGDECSLTRLCCRPGHSCFRKNTLEAYCTAQADPSWMGSVLGHSRWEYAAARAPPGKGAGTTLFCFMAYLPGSNEWNLLQAARVRKASIFACEETGVFKSWRAQFVRQGSWNSVVNIDVFVHVWDEVRKDGRWANYDWTIKVDPDSVFFPDRLRWHLKQLNPPKDKPIYIKNVAAGFGLFGAIEVFSRMAMMKYHNNSKECATAIGSFGGEDGYMKGCMDMIGAGYMMDAGVLRDPHASSCGDGGRVCFHAFKDVGSWVGCWNQARR